MDARELKAYIIENNKIEDILIYLGCHKIKKNDKEIRCALPEHHNPTAVSVKLETLSMVVYSDDLDSRGDIYTFIMDLKKMSFIEAIKLLHSILELEYTKTKKEHTEKEDILSVFKRARAIANAQLQKTKELDLFNELNDEYIFLPHIEWIKEGIMPKTCDKFSIGYDIRTNRILIPHRLWCGGETDYVGVIGRTLVKNAELFDIPKYYPLKPYPKSLNVYGLQENYKSIQSKGVCVVYEAEKSVLKRHSRKDETGVAICGHTMSIEQAKILISLDVDIVIALDRGITLFDVLKTCEFFYGIRNVYYIYDEHGKYLGEKDSPADLNNGKFDELYKTRILYNEQEHNKYMQMKGIAV